MSLEAPNKNKLNLENTLSVYNKEGKALEEKFAPEIQKTVDKISEYLKLDSFEEFQAKKEMAPEYRIGINMNRFVFEDFLGQNLEINVDPGGKSGYCITYDPYGFMNEDDVSEERPENVQEMINKTVSQHERKEVSGIVWSSKGIMKNGFVSDIPHNGLWVSPAVKGNSIGYGLYRLHEKLFGEMKQEEAVRLSLLKLYLRLGFKPKAVLNPLDGKSMEKFDISHVVESYLKEQKEDLDFPIYMERY